MSDALLQLSNVGFRYHEAAWHMEGVSLEVRAGDILGVIGPNGSGKSTLLRVAAGVLKGHTGSVTLMGRDLARQPRRDVARAMGYLPQQTSSTFDYTVQEIVAMGRFPHLAGAGFLRRDDVAIVERCMQATDTAGYRERRLSHLSGGERQRVLLASVLAQEPRVLLLDEPTSALDIHHQVKFFSLLRSLARQGIAVVVVTHDLNLAGLFCRRLHLLAGGRTVIDGETSQVMRVDVLTRVYGREVHVGVHPVTGQPIVLPLPSAQEDAP